ncbi:MAG: helix-turn-helix domain-containing protein [Alphaproteobacteria bacterium]|nr:helix-turn-helix domain-containing protein [Alphaproteobacteria bacterium]
MRLSSSATAEDCLPEWVPGAVQTYLAHTTSGQSIRALARRAGRHPSTLLRQVRRIENQRDDILVDRALTRLAQRISGDPAAGDPSEDMPMNIQSTIPSDSKIDREARRILRRLAEPGACLALADGMENAVVVRDGSEGQTVRTGVVERTVAEAMALRDWIVKAGAGRVLRYRITTAGRAALKRLLAEDESRRVAGSQSAFAEQHRDYDHKDVAEAGGTRKRVRYNLAESPLLALARRRDKGGDPFLSDDLVAAGERLREDFELAQMGPRIAQNWDRFLTAGDRGAFDGGSGPAHGPAAARARVTDALADLGPGLGDVVLRCCCFLEGLEAAEKRMGWSARSGQIVLRIALQRLRQHYDENAGRWSPIIG